MKGVGGETRVARKEPECNIPVLLVEECASKTLQSCVLVKEEDDITLYRKDTRVGERLVTMETSEYGQEGIRASPAQKVAQLRCIYINACSMGSKQEELEAIVLVGNYDVVAITETWWDDSHDWSVAIDGYKLFRRDRRGRRGGEVALYVRKWIDCEELCLRNSCDQVESLWVKIEDRSSKGHLVVGICYRPPDQGESVDKAFLLQLQQLSRSQALLHAGMAPVLLPCSFLLVLCLQPVAHCCFTFLHLFVLIILSSLIPPAMLVSVFSLTTCPVPIPPSLSAPYCPASYPCFHTLPLSSSPPGSLSLARPCSPFSPPTHTFSSLACSPSQAFPSLSFFSPLCPSSWLSQFFSLPNVSLPMSALLFVVAVPPPSFHSLFYWSASLSCCLCHCSSPLSSQLVSYPSLCASVLLPFPLCSFALSALLHTAVSPFSISVPFCTSLLITAL
ncbi:uncharacterized protein LOC121065888 isoform X2 [Cygnus olor]|uniref:uncharacterized protein LOC121065888 isoform X2 n=1 Tax=Cygnus olor TaxID=8869 RepID=UPI001ADDF5DE|nr:uncharacterized protein LOC121065888 isoform X2 [Cygnus olor]